MDPCDPWLVLRIFFRLKSAGSLFEPSAISSLCLPRREKKPRGLRFDSRSTLKNLRIREKQFTHYLKPHPLVQSSLHQVNQERKVSDSRPQDGFLPAGGLCDNISKNAAQKISSGLLIFCHEMRLKVESHSAARMSSAISVRAALHYNLVTFWQRYPITWSIQGLVEQYPQHMSLHYPTEINDFFSASILHIPKRTT